MRTTIKATIGVAAIIILRECFLSQFVANFSIRRMLAI